MDKIPVLGILYNVVSLASPFVFIGGLVLDEPGIVALGLALLVPTLVFPGTKVYKDYWSKFE